MSNYKDIIPNKILDEVINIFKNEPSFYFLDYVIKNNICEKYSDISSIHALCDEILFKLENDGFIRMVTKDLHFDNGSTSQVKGYILTFEGIYFKGYVKNEIDLAHIETRRGLNDKMLTIGTWLAGLGSIALVVFEVLKSIFCTKP